VPNGETYYTWKRENDVETCERLELTNGDKYYTWQRDENDDDVETCEWVELSNGTKLYSWKLENVESCERLEMANGIKRDKRDGFVYQKTENGTWELEDIAN
jgi:hypothetical protein